MIFNDLYNWLTLRDLDKALEEARTSVIKRFARGNVTFQNGNIIDEEKLESIRTLGDKAVDKLRLQPKDVEYGEPKRVRA